MSGQRAPSFDIRAISLTEARPLILAHHAYASVGASATYAFGVHEGGALVACYVWQPPAPGAARSVCPEEPAGVLALSRMAARPREARRLRHISKPLRRQMRSLIDRGRWPVLVTYHDEGLGHTGHVYKCSGWTPTTRARRPVFTDESGARASSYSNGRHGGRSLTRSGSTLIQRWEKWACPRGGAAVHMAESGWVREPIPGKVWRSGNQAHRWVNTKSTAERSAT